MKYKIELYIGSHFNKSFYWDRLPPKWEVPVIGDKIDIYEPFDVVKKKTVIIGKYVNTTTNYFSYYK